MLISWVCSLPAPSNALAREGAAERVTGIEPAWPAWKAGALPLSYTRGASLTLPVGY